MHTLGRDEATLMLALLVGGADGQAHAAEEAAIRKRLLPHLGRLGADGEERTIRLLGELLTTIGLDRTLSSLRAVYRMQEERVEAFRLAAHVAFADGRLRAAEADRVAQIAAALQLTEAELRASLA